MKKVTLLILLILCAGACDTSTVHISERNMELARMLREGKIEESDSKEVMLDLGRSAINKTLHAHGIGNAFEENWMIVEDGKYTIVSGSAAKTRDEVYAFLFLFEAGQGLAYYEIGDESYGNYPSDAILNSVERDDQ